MLSEAQKENALRAPRLPLSFLLEKHDRNTNRESMAGLKDSAIFYRLWDLFDCLREPDVIEILEENQLQASDDFHARMDEMPWQTVPRYPHIKQLEDDDLKPLMELGQSLYDSLAIEDTEQGGGAKRGWRRFFASLWRG